MANNVDNATEGNTEGSIESSAAKVHHVFTNVPGLAQAFLDLCLEEVTKEGYQGSSLKPISWKRRNPAAIIYKKKPLSNAEELYKLFEGTLATGDAAYATGEVGLPDDHVVIDDDDSNKVNDDTIPIPNPVMWSVASDGSEKKRKKVVDEEESDGVQELIGVVKNLVTHMELERIEV
ncbi:hypothetical protein IFM89_018873 [Coptis chinensis]|uniref:Uncharacterized protein n=1 Tax=Coptis chinensis TaxID=261450 RepID=A0A835LM07_9MAGN|nr:hypothetical protein IFM89_018873 [Coptis chinensis]